jgi:proton-translocating NADH-quinone oxidoreductase chain M
MKYFIILLLLLESFYGILIGLNDLTYWMLLLMNIIFIIIILTNENKIDNKFYYILIIILYITFSTSNFFIWYIGFETVLIPMIYIMTKGSSSLKYRYRAIYRFVIYTILGGLLFLYSFLMINIIIGSFNYWIFILMNPISYKLQIYLFPFFLISYLIKLPVIPFHIWLPDTHGEAPTNGSVILAALLLKLGGIGLLRWLIPILPIGYLYYRPLLLILGVLSSVYASITTLRHIDFKKLIAYSSIAHMGFFLIGIISFSYISFKGSLILLISHGFVSSLLFLLIGAIYIRTGTRYIYYYKGLANIIPLFVIFLFLALLLNSAFPPSFSFLAEFFIILGTIQYEFIGTIHLLISVIFSGIYSLFLFCKVSFTKINFNNLYKYKDITLREFYLFSPLILFSIIFSFLN